VQQEGVPPRADVEGYGDVGLPARRGVGGYADKKLLAALIERMELKAEACDMFLLTEVIREAQFAVAPSHGLIGRLAEFAGGVGLVCDRQGRGNL
jgi:hypothetical protein